MFEQPNSVLIAGAGGGLGQALVAEVGRRCPQARLLTISRSQPPSQLLQAAANRHLCVQLGRPEAVQQVREFLRRQAQLPEWVINCCGILHDGDHVPEKSLDQCSDEWLLTSMRGNLLTHLHLAQALGPLLSRGNPLLWASLSAKVGSIGDNQLGGWYSYRISKAALNMLVKNLAIEWGRRLDSSCVVAVHPGTTDTDLSKPFQKRIAPGKLYSPQLSAERILEVLQGLKPSDSGRLLFWDGQVIPW
ncbi:SDR family NAD(P)-dependent oxidoreductase [Microbulbifer sp. TYP-18]|uniref:SDR family NAD(P)-dependent oxidoreductase n=1 Tax=Microbulbifer sp. TYP-18 TaxID=3230024 RepID=UPI0034C68947